MKKINIRETVWLIFVQNVLQIQDLELFLIKIIFVMHVLTMKAKNKIDWSIREKDLIK